jgi:hypothetical protein
VPGGNRFLRAGSVRSRVDAVSLYVLNSTEGVIGVLSVAEAAENAWCEQR